MAELHPSSAFFVSSLFGDRVVLGCPGCPEFAAQEDLELDLPASAFQVGGAGLCCQTVLLNAVEPREELGE